MAYLVRRGIVVRPLCPICKKKEETTMHAIWGRRNLKLVRNVWPTIQGGSLSVL